MRIHFSLWLLPLIALLAACAGQPPLPGTRVGSPYRVGLNLYFPSYDENYDKVGEASWYGPGFNGKQTANGETFHQDDLTAASPTLPMPSLVRVTNLRNGRTLIVRINDRGPFAANRIIDLSKRAAHDLGIRSIAQVRVQFLKKETEDYVARSDSTGHPVSMAFYNNPDNAEEIAMREPEAPPPQSQIVESDVHETHASDTVSSIAPVMTVSSTPLKPAPTNLADRGGHPVHSIGLVHQAWADDNVSLPHPPTADNPPGAQAAADDTEHTDADDPPPARKHTSRRNADDASAMVIQAGAFSTQENAQKLATKLSGIAPLMVDAAATEGRQWWRVRLGPFADEAEAGGVLAKVRALGILDAKIMHE